GAEATHVGLPSFSRLSEFRSNRRWLLMSCMASASRRVFTVLLLGCSLLFLGGCSGGTAASVPPPPVVEVATVVKQDTPIYSEWVAILAGYVNAQIQP